MTRHVPDVKMWPNVLSLNKLLFSLPLPNSEVERMLSALKVVKTARCTSLTTDQLDRDQH